MFRPSERLGHRTGLRWGKAEFAADIRALDGQRFLDVLPLTNSVGREELQCTRRRQQLIIAWPKSWRQ
jgi:hypothetical protein